MFLNRIFYIYMLHFFALFCADSFHVEREAYSSSKTCLKLEMLRSINADEKSWRSRCFEFPFHQLFAEDAKQCLELHDNGVRLVSGLLRCRLLSGNLVFAKARHRGRVLLSALNTGGAFTGGNAAAALPYTLTFPSMEMPLVSAPRAAKLHLSRKCNSFLFGIMLSPRVGTRMSLYGS